MKKHLITASGWIAATGLLAMFLAAHFRYTNLQEKHAGLEQSHQNLAFETRAKTRQADTDRKLEVAESRVKPAATVRPVAAVPAARPQTRVNVRERSPLRARLTRLMEEVGAGSAEEEAQEPVLSSANNSARTTGDAQAATADVQLSPAQKAALAAKQKAARAAKNKSFLANIDKMIADLDETIESGRKDDDTIAAANEAGTSATQEPVVARASGVDETLSSAEKQPAPKKAAPEVQVIYVHPFGSRTSGTWVKYHRYETAGSGKVRFFFGDQEVFSAPKKAIEWEQRVLVN